jgi:hypothetical protein
LKDFPSWQGVERKAGESPAEKFVLTNFPDTGASGEPFPAEERWVLAPNEFSAPAPAPGAFSIQAAAEGRPADPGFLGKAVGSVHKNLEYWESTFEKDDYVLSILKHGYKILVKMTDVEKRTRYRERNNQSAGDDMDFVRAEVDRLLKDGQIIKSERPLRCTNPHTVASKVNADGSVKKRLVIDLSRWVNGFIKPDHFKMARFQDALDQSVKGDYQSVFDISKAYHHLRLHPESYELVGFCVTDKAGKEHFYHYVVVVFGLGPAGQALGRVMRPLLAYLALKGIRNMMY